MVRHLSLLKCLLTGCLLCALLLCCTIAVADETIQVRIPAIASGADCTAALYDSRGHRIQLLKLEKDVGNAFVVECNGLFLTQYSAVVYNEDSDDVSYDRTVYTIYIDVYYGADQQLQSSVIIEQSTSADGAHGGKMGMIRFENLPSLPPATPIPFPTDSPTPLPTAAPTDNNYTVRFSFRKQWSGDVEDSIDWVMYNADGSVRSKLFNKKIISESEWLYEAYFQHAVDGCYIIEYVPDGYSVYYENVGEYAHVTDRCYNGGTIINRKVPQTSDPLPIGVHVICMLAAGTGLIWLRKTSRKQRVE